MKLRALLAIAGGVSCALGLVGTCAMRTQPPIFLTEEEIAASRGGMSRLGLHVSSSDNVIEPLIDGSVVMSRLYDDLEKTRSGDFIHATFWELDLDVMLKPNASNLDDSKYVPLLLQLNDEAGTPTHAKGTVGRKTALGQVLQRAIARGVDLKLLVSENFISGIKPVSTCRVLNSAAGKTVCVPDVRHAHAVTGSNHEKLWMITSIAEGKRQLIVYSGSMDIADDRYDTPAHDPANPERKIEPSDGARTFNWHGNMYRIRGTAAADIERTFNQRWNDPSKPFIGYTTEPYEFQGNNWTTAVDGASTQVQVVRTFGCQGGESGYYQDFAPLGETSYASAFFKAVAGARKYIFLSDQFMWYDEALKALADALPNVEAIVILTNAAYQQALGFNISVWTDTVQHYQYQGLKEILNSPKVHMYVMGIPGEPLSTTKQLYTHTKSLVVDDLYALCGSCGVERAGFTNDAELSMFMHDGESTGFVASLRRSLWATMLETTTDDPVLADPIAAIAAMDKIVKTGDAARLRYFRPQDHGHFFSSTLYGIVEPDGRCNGK